MNQACVDEKEWGIEQAPIPQFSFWRSGQTAYGALMEERHPWTQQVEERKLTQSGQAPDLAGFLLNAERAAVRKGG